MTCKQQQAIALSSAESEYYTLCEAAKMIKFVVQLLMTMGIPVRLPVICRVDNKAAIFMAENATTTQRMRHIDIKHRFIVQMVTDGLIKIIYVKTEDNLADGYTKNVGPDVHEKHTGEYMITRQVFEDAISLWDHLREQGVEDGAFQVREGVGS